MASSQLSDVVHHLRRVVLLRDGAGLTDGQLLEKFVAAGDQDAFAALVRRHAGMVWGVCRRILFSHQDAEDAFQAAFLVLLRKGKTVVPRDNVANWLYGVAYQTALKVRATSAKRGRRKRQVTIMPEAQVVERDLWNDLQPLLDQELARLPEKYRSAIVVCDLEGKTRKDAARQLGMPEGTIASRLARARAMLAQRLGKRGLTVSSGLLAATVTQNAASASVPSAVVSSTIKAASLLAAGQTAAMSAVSIKVAAITEGVLRAMLLSKIKIATAVLLTVGIVAAGMGTTGVLYQGQAAQKAAAEVSAAPAVQQQDAQRNQDKKAKKDVDWTQTEEDLRGRIDAILKETFEGGVVHPPNVMAQDCTKCHGVFNQMPGPNPRAESAQEKINRLERELKTVRAEKELLQIEVWVLLKELQRQNPQLKTPR